MGRRAGVRECGTSQPREPTFNDQPASRNKRDWNIACCPGLTRALTRNALRLPFTQELPLLQEAFPDYHSHPQRLCDLLPSKVIRLRVNFHWLDISLGMSLVIMTCVCPCGT